ncbi:phage tail terminator protein [Ligilactobacillus equi]|uniref:Minor capsid protein n=1 Tax=Ligilactobacillus equi DPC 6820 TaxID=1392007 RepID=V7I0V9_9LACO|nr:minor capsid protein [Ligilactobacillus equi]ETA75093.1 hypothetical protein LEQ_1151 [Ligilactobacillus equi DPC 6820]
MIDLEERLQEAITSANLDLPTELYSGYLSGLDTPELRLMLLPGSQTIEEDMVGNKTRQFLAEVRMRDDDESRIQDTLYKIASFLDSEAFNLQSGNSSFTFTDLTITDFPHLIYADEGGKLIYTLDFSLTVDTYANGKD